MFSRFATSLAKRPSIFHIGLALILALPAFAQLDSGPAPLDLKGTLGDIPSAPTPVDKDGKPIQVQPPTADEREAARKEEALRAESRRRAEEDRQAVETRRADDERRTAEHLAEEQRFHGRIMTAVYVGLAILAVWVGSRIRKRS